MKMSQSIYPEACSDKQELLRLHFPIFTLQRILVAPKVKRICINSRVLAMK